MDLIQLEHLEGIEDKIAMFVFSFTGIKIVEINTPEKVCLRFGNPDLDPLEVGFYPKRHPEKKDFRYSMYVEILHNISNMMKNPAEFEVWCYHHKM